jgi:hypothetical protein
MNPTITATDDAIRLGTGSDHYHNRIPWDMPLNTLGEKASKRRIRFAPIVSKVVGTVLSRDDFSEEEKKDYWTGSGEFALLQTRARLLVMAVKKHGPAYVDFIEDSYKEAQQLSESMVDDDDIDIFFEDPSQYTDKMEMWTEASYGQRGLEKYISPLQENHRESEIREATLIVLVAANRGVSDDDIADLYAALSWSSCIYSRMLGHADYAAAYSTEGTLVQPEPVRMPVLKVETHSVTAIRDLKLKVLQGLKLKRVPMVSRAA